jgi:hypothetical protein
VRVEARRDEHELGREALHRRLDDAGEGVEVLVVSRSRRERDVDRRLRLVFRPPAAGVERPLVERDEQDRVVVAEDRLGAVAVVDVEIDDRHPLQPEPPLRRPGRDRDVVEEAEAHRPASERVMAGRPDEREAAAERGLDRGAGRERRRLERRRGAERVAVEPDRLVDVPHEGDVLRGVAEQQLLLRRRPAFPPCAPARQQDREPLGPLGVATGRVQSSERRVAQDVDSAPTRCATAPRPSRSR